MKDNINPSHYKNHPSGIECIQVTEHFNFNIGNAIKYLWRCGLKGDELEDLRKAEWYIQREIQRRAGITPDYQVSDKQMEYAKALFNPQKHEQSK